MAHQYVAYIDESGDDGVSKVWPLDENGASEWFILSALLVRAGRSEVAWVREILTDLKLPQRKHLHFKDLDDQRKLRVSQAIAKLPARLFVFASNKRNMRGYRNDRAEQAFFSPARNWFYWWATRILLERVTDYCERRSLLEHGSPRPLRLEFSRRGGLYYGHFKAYLHWLRTQSRADMLYLKQGDIKWSVIDSNEIFAFDHAERAGLQLADAVSGSFFRAVNSGPRGRLDTDCAMALAPRLASDRTGRIYGYGFKLMPTAWANKAPADQKQIIDFCRKLRR